MSTYHSSWLHGTNRMDREVKRLAADAYRPPKRGGAWLQRALFWWRERTRKVQVIIQVDPNDGDKYSDEMLSALHQKRCKGVDGLDSIGAVSALVPIRALRDLNEDERIKRISLDREMRSILDVVAPAIEAPRVWETNTTGSNITVAVIDSGIAPHPDLTLPKNRIIGFVDFVNGRSTAYDDHGHGTHIAGTIAGNGRESHGRYKGIAPDANVVGIKVLDGRGRGKMSTVIKGIQWAIANRERYRIRVITVCLGAPPIESFRDDPVAQAVGRAWEAGIVVCAAAGNDGPGLGTIVTPGIHPHVITVGASDDRRDPDTSNDAVALFSSRGPTVDGFQKPDLVVPGVNITATNAARSTIAKEKKKTNSSYIALSGTSMATPVCAGIVALMLESEPDLTPGEVKDRLMASALNLGLDPNVQGAGLVNARRAVLGDGEDRDTVEAWSRVVPLHEEGEDAPSEATTVTASVDGADKAAGWVEAAIAHEGTEMDAEQARESERDGGAEEA